MIAKRIQHKGICQHAQTPYQRRKCRAAKLAAARIAEETQMIKQVTIEHRSLNWRKQEVVTATEYTQIEGTVTATGDDNSPQPGHGRTPIYTIDAGGQIVTVANPQVIATDMRPVQVGDRVRVLATGECLVADYAASTVERI